MYQFPLKNSAKELEKTKVYPKDNLRFLSHSQAIAEKTAV